MMYNTYDKKNIYAQKMYEIKKKEFYLFWNSNKKRRFIYNLNRLNFLRKFIKKISPYMIITPSLNGNYFSNHKIAIYTVIFGDYDYLHEPVTKPDNCDFFIVTDKSINKDTVWKKVDIDMFSHKIKDLNNMEKNRFFKISPHFLFPTFKYSIYIDGNIVINTDFTEYINRVENMWLGVFGHFRRKCVYKEIDYALKIKRGDANILKEQYNYLISNKMPIDYGVVEACFIVREHNSTLCRKIMEEWWCEFKKFPSRDQISLPFVLWKNNLTTNKITILGEDIYSDFGFSKRKHRE